jgi:predicted nucleic acid-binding protein
MAAYLLDTGILIRHLRGQRVCVRLVRELGRKQRLMISAVTRTEVWAGALEGQTYVTRRLLGRMETVPVDRAVADRAGDLIRRARGQGRTLHVVDALIAATALQQNATLVTLNVRHVAGLGVRLYPISAQPTPTQPT